MERTKRDWKHEGRRSYTTQARKPPWHAPHREGQRPSMSYHDDTWVGSAINPKSEGVYGLPAKGTWNIARGLISIQLRGSSYLERIAPKEDQRPMFIHSFRNEVAVRCRACVSVHMHSGPTLRAFGFAFPSLVPPGPLTGSAVPMCLRVPAPPGPLRDHGVPSLLPVGAIPNPDRPADRV
jgi:hypothetical protein